MQSTEPTAGELAEYSRILGLLRALPVDDRRRLRAEREAESFARDGRRVHSSARRQVRGGAGGPVWGVLLKDYRVAAW